MNTEIHPINRAFAEKVLAIVDAGLVRGKGIQEAGKMCVEAAVCLAFGLPHSDDPPCVGKKVRAFKIRLNDSDWSDDVARTAGLRKLAVAQLGSDTIDQDEFARIVARECIKQIVPIALRAAAKLNPLHANRLEDAAVTCVTNGDMNAADAAAIAARYTANAAAIAAGFVAADAADAARYTADAARYTADAARYTADAARYAARYTASAADAARYTANVAGFMAADAARYTASAAGFMAADAARYAASAAKERDRVLNILGEIGLRALIELKSPGCEYLSLCNK